jgi:prolipoprotein diacylglyceryltransferase
LILWFTRHYKSKAKPGAAFAMWLILAGVGRFFIEFFRPDQPRVPGTGVSYTRIANVFMILAGILLLLIKYEVLRLPFLSPGTSSYVICEAEPSDAEAHGIQE